MLQDLLHGMVAQTAGGDAQPSPIMSVLPFILMFGVFYFLMIRPQNQQRKAEDTFRSQLKKGDEVLVSGGFFVKVVSVQEADVTAEIAPGVKIRVLKSAIVPGGTKPAAEAKAEDEKKAEKKD